MKVAKRVDLKISYYKKKNSVIMYGDESQTYYGDQFTIYTNIKSLCCTPETNTMLCTNQTSTTKKSQPRF